jgi:hypothetical protein
MTQHRITSPLQVVMHDVGWGVNSEVSTADVDLELSTVDQDVTADDGTSHQMAHCRKKKA